MSLSSVPKELLEQCRPDQYKALVELFDRLIRAEAAAAAKKPSSKDNASTGKGVPTALNSGTVPEHPKVSDLKSKFENKNNRRSKVMTLVSKAMGLNKTGPPPPRPMTLARKPRNGDGAV